MKATGVRASLKLVLTLKKALMRVKDKLPGKDKAGVAYAVPCGWGDEYVGETGRTLSQCITEHCKAVFTLSAIIPTDLPLPNMGSRQDTHLYGIGLAFWV